MPRAEINNAVLQMSSTGGRGVLIGQIVVTAAHCIKFSTDGSMIVGGYSIEEVRTWRGDRLKLMPLAVEPVADIAVLGGLDAQQFPDEAEAFEEYLNITTPVPLARKPVEYGQPFAIHVLNANGTWTAGEAELFDESDPHIWIEAESEVEGGASGGPILNQDNELVAIVSNSSVPTPGLKSTGRSPRPLKALPRWICERYLR